MLFLAVETLVAECWMGPTLAVLAEEAPPEVRVLPSRAPHSRFRPSRAAHSRLRQLLPPSLTLLR
jgi:hypothetical protein